MIAKMSHEYEYYETEAAGCGVREQGVRQGVSKANRCE